MAAWAELLGPRVASTNSQRAEAQRVEAAERRAWAEDLELAERLEQAESLARPATLALAAKAEKQGDVRQDSRAALRPLNARI